MYGRAALGAITLLLNLTAPLVGWYRISLQGLLRLYEKPFSRINARNTTCERPETGGGGGRYRLSTPRHPFERRRYTECALG